MKKVMLVLITAAVITIVNILIIGEQYDYNINLQYLGEKQDGRKRTCYFYDNFVYLRVNCKDYDYIKETMMNHEEEEKENGWYESD